MVGGTGEPTSVLRGGGGHCAVNAGVGGLPRKRQRASLHAQGAARALFHSLQQVVLGPRTNTDETQIAEKSSAFIRGNLCSSVAEIPFR